MKKSYLLVYDSNVGNRDAVKEILNQINMVDKWRYDLPHTFYIISEYTANQLMDAIRKITGEKGRFIITEIPENNSNGYLTEASWYLIENKRYKPKNS